MSGVDSVETPPWNGEWHGAPCTKKEARRLGRLIRFIIEARMRCLRWQLRLGGMASQDSDLWKIPVDGVPPARPFLVSEGHTYVSIWLTFSIPLYIRFLKTSACCVSMFLSLFLSSLLLFTL